MKDSKLKKIYKYLYYTLLNDNTEQKQLTRFIKNMGLPDDSIILDIGCGYGRNMRLLRDGFAYKAIGIDINAALVRSLREEGFECYTVDEYSSTQIMVDCIIMSHIIEHLAPNELLAFLNEHLAHLKTGGHLIIATPLLSKEFYFDFDHIKPYMPIGIDMVFGGDNAQVQYYGDVKLELSDIWFRRSPYRVVFKRSLYIESVFSIIWGTINLLFTLLFRLSFGVLGRYTGWMAVYRKYEV